MLLHDHVPCVGDFCACLNDAKRVKALVSIVDVVGARYGLSVVEKRLLAMSLKRSMCVCGDMLSTLA